MKKPILSLIQAVLCVLSAAALIAAAFMIFFEGLAARSNDPLAEIFSAGAIADKAVFVVPFLCASIIVTIICALLGVKTEENCRAKDEISVGKSTGDEKLTESSLSRVRGVIFLIAVILIIIGIFNGSFDDVFIKASNICTECIGLG